MKEYVRLDLQFCFWHVMDHVLIGKMILKELKDARDLTHKEFLSHTTNDEYREDLWRLLSVFDKKISDLEWNGKVPCGPAYHREHGYNLYKPD